MSLTVSTHAVDDITVIELQGAVDDAVLRMALESLRSMSEEGGRLVIDLDELTVSCRVPLEAVAALGRDPRCHAEFSVICRRGDARQMLAGWEPTIPVYDSLDALLADPRERHW